MPNNNFEHIIHKHSSVVTNGNPKLPTTNNVEYGEIAVNYAKDHETISLKNSNNEIVTFSSDNAIKKLINDDAYVISNSLNDLNSRIGAVEDRKMDKINGTSSQFVKGDGSLDSNAYAPKASPALTGTPTAPTASSGTNTTQIATTAFVQHTIKSYNVIKITSSTVNGVKVYNETEIANISDGMYKLQYVTVTGSGSNAVETLNQTATLIQWSSSNRIHQRLYGSSRIVSKRVKVNNTWSNWSIDSNAFGLSIIINEDEEEIREGKFYNYIYKNICPEIYKFWVYSGLEIIFEATSGNSCDVIVQTTYSDDCWFNIEMGISIETDSETGDRRTVVGVPTYSVDENSEEENKHHSLYNSISQEEFSTICACFREIFESLNPSVVLYIIDTYFESNYDIDAYITNNNLTIGYLTGEGVTSFNGQTGNVTFTQTQLSKGTTSGSGNAVTDINVSNHQITLVKGATYAPLASPALTGTPTAPTAASGTNTTQIATTAFVQSALPTVPATYTLSLNATKPEGWYRVAKLGKTFSGIVTISGQYYAKAPTIATFSISARQTDAASDIIQLGGNVNGNIDKIRLVSNENGDNVFYLDVYKATSGNIGNVYISFNGTFDLENAVTNTVLSEVASTYIRETFEITDITRNTYQTTSNLVTSISSTSTDTQYPSAKCVYDLVGNIETLLASI